MLADVETNHSALDPHPMWTTWRYAGILANPSWRYHFAALRNR